MGRGNSVRDVDDRGVSSVIAVILMVAVTVILAAVVGAFAFDMGHQIGDETPQASFTFEFSAGAGSSSNEINITHDGGDTLDREDVIVLAGAETIYEEGSPGVDVTVTNDWATDVSAGESLDIRETGNVWEDGDDLRIVWENPQNDNVVTIAETTIDF